MQEPDSISIIYVPSLDVIAPMYEALASYYLCAHLVRRRAMQERMRTMVDDLTTRSDFFSLVVHGAVMRPRPHLLHCVAGISPCPTPGTKDRDAGS